MLLCTAEDVIYFRPCAPNTTRPCSSTGLGMDPAVYQISPTALFAATGLGKAKVAPVFS
jgi:hypothetical protein